MCFPVDAIPNNILEPKGIAIDAHPLKMQKTITKVASGLFMIDLTPLVMTDAQVDLNPLVMTTLKSQFEQSYQ